MRVACGVRPFRLIHQFSEPRRGHLRRRGKTVTRVRLPYLLHFERRALLQYRVSHAGSELPVEGVCADLLFDAADLEGQQNQPRQKRPRVLGRWGAGVGLFQMASPPGVLAVKRKFRAAVLCPSGFVMRGIGRAFFAEAGGLDASGIGSESD